MSDFPLLSQSFIMEVREKVKVNDKTSHRCSILPLKEETHQPYVDLTLQEGGVEKGLLKIRRYDLRLIDYQYPCGISLNVDEFQIYDDESKIVKFGIEGLELGLSTFSEAVNHLENVSKNPDFYEHNKDVGTSFLMVCDTKKVGDTQGNFKIRTSLGVLCLVLCEAVKVDLFSCLLGNAFEFGYEVSMTSWLLDRINDWSFFSEQLLADTVHYTDTIDECNTCLPINLNDWPEDRRVIGITCSDITKFLGICKAIPSPVEPIKEICILDGKCLVEIFSVSAYFSDGHSGDVYGSIKVKTDYGTYSIYERDYNESEFVESHGILSIQDSNGFISPLGVVEFYIDLKERGGNVEIAKGKIMWEDTLEEDF
ncbi:unnamed protein product [Amaranthus hypochondriacus]